MPVRARLHEHVRQPREADRRHRQPAPPRDPQELPAARPAGGLRRYKELLAPDKTVEHPHYRLHESGQSLILDGIAQVTAFYEQLIVANAIVMWVNSQDIAVNDHGFSGEAEFYAFVPAPMLGESAFANGRAGETSEMYLLKRTLAFVWPYDERARLIGEHVYEDHASREIVQPDPADVITAERARELLAPEIDKPLP